MNATIQTAIELCSEKARHWRKLAYEQRRVNYYAEKTAKAKILQGRIEAAETILAELEKLA